MDIDKLLSGAIQLSGFVTVRLVFFLALAILVAPYFGYTETGSEELTVSLPIVQELVDQYSRIVEALGIKSVAIYLLFFVFISALHLCFEAAVTIGNWVPLSLNGEKLQVIERRFSKEIVETLLGKQENPETITRFTAACQACNETMDPEVSDRVDTAGKSYNAVKAYLLAFVLCVYIFPSEIMFAEIAASRSILLAAILILVCVTAFTRYDSLRARYAEFMDALEDCVEKHLRPSVAPTTYRELTPVCARFKRAFRVRPDWHLPVVGPIREIAAFLREAR